MAEFCIHEKHGGICEKVGTYCNLGACPDEDLEEYAPVRHGRWVSVPHKLARVCSVCNRDEPYKFADIDADVYDYCPNCGARMNEEVKHER